MPTAKDICNLGLGKIGSSRVNNLTPPKSVIEGLCASGYAQWKDSELRKRRWVFAMKRAQIFPTAESPLKTLDAAEKPYQYNLPGDCLRPLRPRATSEQWEQREQFIYSPNNVMVLDYIRRVDDNLITDANFIDVLAWRIAIELVEPTSQANTKQVNTAQGYLLAVQEAGRINAFIIEPGPSTSDDASHSWIEERLNMHG